MTSYIVCAYLAEQANWLLSRIEQSSKSLDHRKHNEKCKQISDAKILVAEALGAISVISRDGASEKKLAEYQDIGRKMNSAVRF